MDVLLTIGEFSKMTYLTVKALRHYHDVGLLEPAHIDPATGYRHYAADQVGAAQAIRRFRDLDMPLEEIQVVLASGDPEARDRAIAAHLERLQDQLARTQTSVAALQALLRSPRALHPVEDRLLPATLAIATTAPVAFDDAGGWCEAIFAELHARLGDEPPAGPDTVLYPAAFFELGVGDCTAFVPVGADGPGTILVPESRVTVMVHDGPFADLDQTYGALGTVVAQRGTGVDGPIREHYLVDDHTEVCWPVTG